MGLRFIQYAFIFLLSILAIPTMAVTSASDIHFTNVTSTGLTINWPQDSEIMDQGGYVIYMAEQFDLDTGMEVSEFVQLTVISDKNTIEYKVTGLTSCHQYFFKVVSYIGYYSDTSTTIDINGLSGSSAGTIPGFSAICDLIGGPYNDRFNLYAGGETVTEYAVTIGVDDMGNRVYDVISPGSSVEIGLIDGGSDGSDSLYLTGAAVVSLGSVVVSGDVNITANNIENISADSSSENTLIGTDSQNVWIISDNNSGTLNDTVTFSNFTNLIGSGDIDTFNLSTVSVSGSCMGTVDSTALTISSDSAVDTECTISTSSFDFDTSQLFDIDITQTDEIVNQRAYSLTQLEQGESITYGDDYIAVVSGFDSIDLPEDSAPGTLITTAQVKFLGRDSSIEQMTYVLTSGNDDGVFAINNKTGELSLVKILDFEQVAQYLLEVTVSDGGATYVGKLTINITDVTEQELAAGCTLYPGAAFDPLWTIMFLLAGLYTFRRSNNYI